jgi:hypothetical protein
VQQIPIIVTASATTGGPFAAPWTTGFIGYIQNNLSTATPGILGSAIPNVILDYSIQAVGALSAGNKFMLYLAEDAPTNLFSQVTTVLGTHSGTYLATSGTYVPQGTTSLLGATIAPTTGPLWYWTDTNSDFTSGSITTVTVTTITPPGNGDITNPGAWEDFAGNIPPLQWSNVPYNVNYPLNGDGRYWFEANAFAPNTNVPIAFIGSTAFYTDSINLQWSVVQAATDSSSLILAYSTNGGGTWTSATLLPQVQLGGLQNGQIVVPLTGATGLQVQVYSTGGTALSTAALSQVALAITRNVNEGLQWDSPNPYNAAGYNGAVVDNVVPTDTMADLQQRILIRLGFANQAANPPPGMASLVQDFLTSAQKFLYRRYLQLHTKRLFRWKINPGQRFYSLKDNDENVLEGVNMDYAKTVEWVGIQDTRNVWYPMIQGIPPQLFTMITKPWRPARYEIKNVIELYPVPDQTYWLWIKGHFGLMPFTLSTQTTTIDSELVFLHALANAKAHYGQPDANNIEAQANAYRMELIASTHQTAHYVPGTIAVPPAVRPTLIQFDANNGGGS